MPGQFAPRSAARTVAAAVVAVECGVIALGALAYVALGIVGDDSGTQASLALAGVGALAAAGLFVLARGLWHARRWAVSPSITWQLLQGFVGAYLITAGQPAYGAAALGVAVIGLVALMALARGAGSAGQDLDGERGAVDDRDAP
ncbi:MAG: hypothetical protein NVV57_08465 [Demequina sp.]|nr:hypothetical protein [Demequina sp.]